MSSAICFNLDQPKILSSGNGKIESNPSSATGFRGLIMVFVIKPIRLLLLNIHGFDDLYTQT